MAHQFPETAAYGAALRFALEAEQACADFAAAAGVLAPTREWQDKLEEIVCTHDDRVQKLMVTQQEAAERLAAPVGSLDGSAYLGTLDAEPITTWPGAVRATDPGGRGRRALPRGVRREVRRPAAVARPRLRQECSAGPRGRGRAQGDAGLASACESARQAERLELVTGGEQRHDCDPA